MLKVEYVRDGLTEEFHEGVFSIARPCTDFNFGCADETPYYIRSCAKPLQAVLLLEAGVELSPEELALCCGSHAGEECHIKTAENILKKFDIPKECLKCGVHSPLSKGMQKRMLLKGEEPNQLHNNCSGKHIGFLCVCKKMGWDLSEYDSPKHSLQIAVRNKINEMCQIKGNYPMTTDGCGVPIVSMPLKNLVTGYMSLLNYPQIVNAIRENPYIFGGEDRTDTEIIQRTENLIAKVGAGGLCVVLNIKEKNAFAVKINDASMEARRFALFELINRLGWGDIDYDSSIKTISGKIVGKVLVNIE